jgi:hypothetical protein
MKHSLTVSPQAIHRHGLWDENKGVPNYLRRMQFYLIRFFVGCSQDSPDSFNFKLLLFIYKEVVNIRPTKSGPKEQNNEKT